LALLKAVAAIAASDALARHDSNWPDVPCSRELANSSLPFRTLLVAGCVAQPRSAKVESSVLPSVSTVTTPEPFDADLITPFPLEATFKEQSAID
jgi:hypothetical protein